VAAAFASAVATVAGFPITGAALSALAEVAVPALASTVADVAILLTAGAAPSALAAAGEAVAPDFTSAGAAGPAFPVPVAGVTPSTLAFVAGFTVPAFASTAAIEATFPVTEVAVPAFASVVEAGAAFPVTSATPSVFATGAGAALAFPSTAVTVFPALILETAALTGALPSKMMLSMAAALNRLELRKEEIRAGVCPSSR
jgi:hypothetical protein